MRTDGELPPSIGDVLGQILGRRRGLRTRLRREELFVRWPEIVGRDLSDRIHPLTLKGRTLYLGASSSSWAQEASLLNSEILERIECHLGAGVVDQLRVRVTGSPGTRERAEKDPARPQGAGLPEMPGYLEPGEDLDLKERLQRIEDADRKVKEWRREQGWPECGECGQLFPPDFDDELCPVCRRHRRQQLQMRVRVLLEDAPWMSINQLMRETGADRECCRRVRQDLISYWRARVDDGVKYAEARGKIRSDFRRRVLQLMMAEAGDSQPKLNRSAVGDICGSSAADLFFDGELRRD